MTERQRALFHDWSAADVIFQITGDEVGRKQGKTKGFDRGRISSFLFVAAELESGRNTWHTRTYLAEVTRLVNAFPMPVVIIFRDGDVLSIGAVRRRKAKRDEDRDVLERVTLIKDIRLANPHRAHLDILAKLSLTEMAGRRARNFDHLHAMWEGVLDTRLLNVEFFKLLYEWFERAVKAVRRSEAEADTDVATRKVIRLIARILFIWFMREKGLVPERLFTENFARKVLRDYRPTGEEYYRGVMENLFFATLNAPIEERTFDIADSGNGVRRRYRHRHLLSAPEELIDAVRDVPFVNGGLFDRIDEIDDQADESGDKEKTLIDETARGRAISGELLLGESGLFPLLRKYKFTVEESTSLDQEVALDPELLGRVFENLLAAYNPETRELSRSRTGSYYTPRDIVDYMVRETLADALVEKMRPPEQERPECRLEIARLLDHEWNWEDGGSGGTDLAAHARARARPFGGRCNWKSTNFGPGSWFRCVPDCRPSVAHIGIAPN